MGKKKTGDGEWLELELPFDEVTPTMTPIITPPPGIGWDPAPTPEDKQCKEEHPTLGKELLCEDEKKHNGDHNRFIKGEWWEWKKE